MTSSEIRASFLHYFGRHGHRIVYSSPLVPRDDPTLLFTNAGMNQFKDLFLGRDSRDYSRAASAQKCMRVSGKHNDLDNVGPSFRHHTFFEMLGNFSFGDYFKQDAIPFAWTLLTEQWKIPQERLCATVFRGESGVARDIEAYDIWRKFLPAERIGELGAADNFWQMGDSGPCGRCSEIYYFRGAELPCSEEAAGSSCRGVGCSCERYVEIWNNVFMEFDRHSDGSLAPLPAPSIDTGMGLERVTAVLQGRLSTYETDLFAPLLAAIGEAAKMHHRGTMDPHDVSMRVVADHMRATTFLIADGVVPSNEWRGYVLRKIMRRAMRHGKRLGCAEPFLHTLVDTIVREFGEAYPEVRTGRDAIVRVVRSEEERFDAVLTDGLPRLEELLDRSESGNGTVPGQAAFKLYDTYGLPRDFIEDMIEDRRLALDRDGFERAMDGQREKARAKSSFKGSAREATWKAFDETRHELERLGDGGFRGYETTSLDTRVVAVFGEDRAEVEELRAGRQGFVALADTPFYLEAGGQVSDVGTMTGLQGEARVTDVTRAGLWPRVHAVEMIGGRVRRGDSMSARVTETLRDATRRNHTGTHLLHAALRQVLGGHVKQAGSLVAPDRLRFDFAHFSAIAPEQIFEIERIVNGQIIKDSPVLTEVRPTEEAMASGAMALFGEKYGDMVRVVSIPGFSTELCGGTHVRATGEIGLFAIVSEGGVAAGVRRIEATTGFESLEAFQRSREEIGRISAAINARPGELANKITSLQEEGKRMGRELQQARMKAALGAHGSSDRADEVLATGATLVTRSVEGLDRDGLRALVDQHRARIKSGVVVVASPSDDKVAIVVGVTPDLVRKVPAGHVVKQLAPIVGGGGGGRPDFAEAGGRDASKIGEMLAASRAVIEKMLSA